MDINNLRQKLQETTDRLGKKIDGKIFDTILYLNAHGFKTTGSCEGHLDYGLAYPWIDFSSVDNEEREELDRVSDQLRKILDETNNDYDDENVLKKKRQQDELINEIQRQNSAVAERLLILLSDFYQNRKVDIDARLIICDMVTDFRLQPQGGMLQADREEDKKKIYLEKYQQEMSDLTDFLKTKTEIN